MKKISIKKVLLIFISYIIVFVVGVNAASGYKAEEIYYSATGTSVTSALDDLYGIKTELTSLKQVGTASATNILTGTNAAVKGTKVDGSMANNGGLTKTSDIVTESGTNVLITIPSNGYYNTSSKLSVPIDTIKTNISSLQTTYTTKTSTSVTSNGGGGSYTFSSLTVGQKYMIVIGGMGVGGNPFSVSGMSITNTLSSGNGSAIQDGSGSWYYGGYSVYIGTASSTNIKVTMTANVIRYGLGLYQIS